MTERVTIKVEGQIADVRLARPDKMNALDTRMFQAIIAACKQLSEMDDIRAIVLSGDGRGFCAGLDLQSVSAQSGDDPGGLKGDLSIRTQGNSNDFQAAAMMWRALRVPVIAAVHGVCFGGGLQIASGADIRIVAPDARLSVMEMKWGLVPDVGGYALWRHLVRDDVLRELIYTNREFSGEEAQNLGFATYVDAAPFDRAMAIARQIVDKNPSAIRAAKRLSNRLPDMDEDSILAEESAEQNEIIWKPNQVEAVMAQMQKRAPNFKD